MNQDKVFIFGASDLAELLQFHLQHTTSYQVQGFVVDREYLYADTFCNLPVYATDYFLAHFLPSEYGIFVAAGYNNMNFVRKQVSERLLNFGYEILNYIHPSAHVYGKLTGQGNIVMQNVLIDYETTVGSGNIFYAGALIAHHNSVGNYNFFAVNSCIAGHVKIGDECFFGANSTVQNDLQIANRTLVGASAQVAQSTEPSSVLVGSKAVLLDGKHSSDFTI